MGKKKRRKTAFEWYIYQRGWLKFFFLSFIFFFDFGFGFTVALLAWRVVFFLLVGVGLGLGLYTTWGKVLPSTGLQVHVTFLLLMRWEEGMEGRAGGVRTLLLEIENRQKFATVGLGGGGGLFL